MNSQSNASMYSGRRNIFEVFYEPLFKMIEKQEAEGIRMIPYQSVEGTWDDAGSDGK